MSHSPDSHLNQQSDVEHESVTLRPSNVDAMDEAQDLCDTLVSNSNIDKEAALGIVRLHNAMKTKQLCMCFEKDRQIDKLDNELKVASLMRRQAEMVSSMTDDLVKLKGTVNAMTTQIQELRESTGHMRAWMGTMSQKPGKR